MAKFQHGNGDDGFKFTNQFQLQASKQSIAPIATDANWDMNKWNADITIRCKICYDPIIEATTSSCGHLFCHDCIYSWQSFENSCPICRESLSSLFGAGSSKLHRVYEIDRVIEVQLPNFPKDVQARLKSRVALRMAKIKNDSNSSTFALVKISRFFTSTCARIRIHFASKGFLRGTGRLIYNFWRFWTYYIWSRIPWAWIICTFIFTYCLASFNCGDRNVLHFVHYLWNAIRNYPGYNQVQNTTTMPVVVSTTEPDTGDDDDEHFSLLGQGLGYLYRKCGLIK